ANACATRSASSPSSSSPTQASNRSPSTYTASAVRASPARNASSSAVIAGRSGSRCRSERKSVVIDDDGGRAPVVPCGCGRGSTAARGRGGGRVGEDLGALDHDRYGRHVARERAL